MSSNGNKPAYPIDIEVKNIDSDSLARQIIKEWDEKLGYGLSKREKACIELGVPETGDPELDKLIRKAERKKIAMVAMRGLLSNPEVVNNERDSDPLVRTSLSEWAIAQANDLLKELEQTND